MENFESLDDDVSSITSEDWTSDFKKNQQRKRFVTRIVEHCGKDDGKSRPRHVAIIGFHGVGKSSFVNTLAAALGGDRWREFAFAGSYGPKGGGVTFMTKSYKKCGMTTSDKYNDALLPTLIDFAGFDDHADDVITELLRIVFYGCLPEDKSLAQAEECYKRNGLSGLRATYATQDEKLKVDRIIFVSSATVNVPENLIKCVREAARPPGTMSNPRARTISVFGVLTKYDKVVSADDQRLAEGDKKFVSKENYGKIEGDFIRALGFEGSSHRFLRCSNYCDDVDKEKRRLNTVLLDIDLPVLEFFSVVTDPVYDVQNEQETYASGVEDQTEVEEVISTPIQESQVRRRRRTTDQNKADTEPVGSPPPKPEVKLKPEVSVLLIVIEALIVVLLVSIMFTPAVDMVRLRAICKYNQNHATDSQHELHDFCKDVDSSAFGQKIRSCACAAAMILVRIGFSLAPRYFHDRT